MPAAIILIEASPRRAADGVVETVRLAGGGGEKPYYYNGQHWRAGVVQLPTFITSLDFEGGDVGTGGVPQAAELQWAPASQADVAALASYFWIDAAITVRIGPEGAFPPVALTGKVLDAPIEGGVLKIQLIDPAADLKKPLLTARFAGTGGLEGPAEWEGKIRKRVWGRVWNIAGEPIDKANNVYCFADPTRQLYAFDDVRDMGAPAAELDFLAWAGSTAATFAALQAAQAPQGGGVVCPSIACVKWWTQPAGDLTADLRGEVGAGYVETTAEIAQRIVQALGGPTFAAGTIAAAVAARPAPVGWVAKDDSTTVAAMIEELFGSVSLLWLLDSAGQIIVREWAWGASAATVQSLIVSRKKVLRPLATRKLGYRRNELPMARGDLAAIVLATEVAYLDGTPIEDLKPAEPGATNGATAAQIDAIEILIADAQAAAAGAQATADGKVTTFLQTSAPTAEGVGDLWIDTDDGNKLYRWSGSAWTAVQDNGIAQALTNAANAQATADGKVRSFYQTSAPTAEGVGDFWIDTDDGNKLYRWSGSAWVNAQDAGIGQAITDAANAQATADTKRTVFYQATAPSHLVSEENDLWINSADGNKLYRRVPGSGRLAIGGNRITIGGNYIALAWTEADDQRVGQAVLAAAGAQATADGKVQAFTMFYASDPVPTAEGVGDLLYRLYTSPVQVDRWSGSAWEAVATVGATQAQLDSIGQALTDASNAQATADGKIETFYQTTMPSGSEGDLWIDTDDGNKLYRHNGSTFVAVQDAGIAEAITDAAGAQATADGKVTTFVGESTPTAEGVGDLWYKASDKTTRRWTGSAWAVASPTNVADGATVGADWSVNLGNRPAELTDGRVSSGLNSDGTVKDGKVYGPAIQPSAVTADKIDVNSLEAISAIIGTLRTATTGARTEIKDNLITVYDSANTLRVRMGVWS